jgi:hypothetical protein
VPPNVPGNLSSKLSKMNVKTGNSNVTKLGRRVRTVNCSCGRKYTGEVDKEGRPHGGGIMWYAEETDEDVNHYGDDSYRCNDENKKFDRYEGQLKDGVREGPGIIYYRSGSELIKYDGEWKSRCQHGHGTEWYSKGGRYEGEWEDKKRHGHGIAYDSEENQCGEEWEHGLRVKTIEYECGDRYKGEYNDDEEPHGQGTMFWSDGDRYEGQWKLGSMEGHGNFCYANGDEYQGWFKNDKRHGEGTMTTAKQNQYGMWHNGKYNGTGECQIPFNQPGILNKPQDSICLLDI